MEPKESDHGRRFALRLPKLLAAVTFLGALTGAFAVDEVTLSSHPISQPELISAIKVLESTLGFEPTNNFSSYSDNVAAYYRCYYTGKMELPESYEGLKLKDGTQDGCVVDAEKYDVFFYPIDAVANGKTPVTASLAKSSTERLLVVVPHEDFHEDRELWKLPASLSEPASTLIGFLTAREVARQKLGVDSEVYQKLSKEAGLFLQKAEMVNRYHARLRGLYAAARSGEVSKPEALALKEKLFGEIGRECKAISPNPSSFNKCPSATNNAGLAFDMTYTKNYPLMYELYPARGQDLKATVNAVKQALAAGSAPEDFLHLEEFIHNASRPSSR